MGDITYLSGIVKILETPKQKSINNDINVVRFRAQLNSVRKTQIVTIMFWGKLAQDVVSYYKIHHYLIIEGYPSFRNSRNSKKTSKRVEITGLRVYPFSLKTSNLNNKL